MTIDQRNGLDRERRSDALARDSLLDPAREPPSQLTKAWRDTAPSATK
jgi:hypothetical protein